jgi:4-azaleucine resistance transporter AzlC
MKYTLYKKAMLKGVFDMMPLNLAVIPWGILCGSLAIQRGFSVIEALLMPLVVFAGSVQLVAIELIASNASLATILFTAFIISSRHFLYGLALREKLSVLTPRWRLSLGFLLTDELFALSGSQKSLLGPLRLLYGLCAGASFYFCWLLWNIIGIFAGSYLPDLTTLGLDFAIAVTFIALVVPSITSLPIGITVLVSAVFSVVFSLLGWQLGLVLASLLGMLAGYIAARMVNKIHRGDHNDCGENNLHSKEGSK